MKKESFLKYENLLLFVLLLIISALVYLPRISQIGYTNDDWYLMYSAHAYGPQSFVDIYSIDRPARALVMIPAYTLFGDNPLYYNLSAYLFRLISALSLLWLLQMLWPRARGATFMVTLLFLIYPGFLSQANGIDYQSQMVSLAAAILSIALGVKASMVLNTAWKFFLFLASVLLGWLYLGLVEYFIGLEIMRFGSFYLLAYREQTSWKEKIFTSVRRWLPSSIIPMGFLLWRVFFFQSERGATDISSQFDQFKEIPLATGVRWILGLATNSLDVMFLAWGVPFSQMIGNISRLRDLFIGGACVVVITLLVVWGMRRLNSIEKLDPSESRDWRMEALCFGVVLVIVGVLPVILVNRGVDFSRTSRYALAGSVGSALILVSILYFIPSQFVRWSLTTLLLTIAVFTHHANSIRLANNTASLRSFWWQVSWRVPQLKPGTTLIANYPLASIEEDYFVWGPASLIYYPEAKSTEKINVELSAAVLNKYSILKIISDSTSNFVNRRMIRSTIDYQNILVLTQPSQGSCVQVIDGNAPLLSQFEDNGVMVISPHSNISNILLDEESHIPPEIVFGPEPPHDWCYYFEKADLARQRGDWDQVRGFGDEVLKKRLAPSDPIEWMPFLQAFAQAGDVDALQDINRFMKKVDPFVRQQVCQSLHSLQGLSVSVVKSTDNLFCSE
jgi:hypothetical protein